MSLLLITPSETGSSEYGEEGDNPEWVELNKTKAGSVLIQPTPFPE